MTMACDERTAWLDHEETLLNTTVSSMKAIQISWPWGLRYAPGTEQLSTVNISLSNKQSIKLSSNLSSGHGWSY